MIGFGRVPPRFDIVFRSCSGQYRHVQLSGKEREEAAHSHVCSSDQGIRDLSVESSNSDELNGTKDRVSFECLRLYTVEDNTHLATDDNNVVAMMIPKYPLLTCPVGKPQTTNVAIEAIVNLAQKAHNQGLNT